MNENFLDDLSQSLGLHVYSNSEQDGSMFASVLEEGLGAYPIAPMSTPSVLERRSSNISRESPYTSVATDAICLSRHSTIPTAPSTVQRTHNSASATSLDRENTSIEGFFSYAAADSALSNLFKSTNSEIASASDEIQPERKPKHVCAECGKFFKRAHNLKIHGRLHSGVKPYRCPFEHCRKEFRWKSSIVSHLNWHRTKRGENFPGLDDLRDISLITKPASTASTIKRMQHQVQDGRKHNRVPPHEVRQSTEETSDDRMYHIDPQSPNGKSHRRTVPMAISSSSQPIPTMHAVTNLSEARNRSVMDLPSYYLPQWSGELVCQTNSNGGNEAGNGSSEEIATAFTPSTQPGSQGGRGSPHLFDLDGLCPSLPFLSEYGAVISNVHGHGLSPNVKADGTDMLIQERNADDSNCAPRPDSRPRRIRK